MPGEGSPHLEDFVIAGHDTVGEIILSSIQRRHVRPAGYRAVDKPSFWEYDSIFDGIAIYLQSYHETGESLSVTLLAVHDPGYGLIIATGFLLVLGLNGILSHAVGGRSVRLYGQGN